MLKWLLRRQLAGFERTWNYDVRYVREIIDADPRAIMILSRLHGLAKYRNGLPLAAYWTAGIVAVMAADCGPCTQLCIDMAQREGVDPAILRAVVARDYAAMPEDIVLAVRFTEATLRHAPGADELREEVLRRFGQRGLISLAFSMLSARVSPTLKYALGHGRACTQLVIGGEAQPMRSLTEANTLKANPVAA